MDIVFASQFFPVAEKPSWTSCNKIGCKRNGMQAFATVSVAKRAMQKKCNTAAYCPKMLLCCAKITVKFPE
jgi:hypothetical protein